MQEIYCERYNILNMENAEDVMQLLEEFSKVKPKDIPRELDEYLGYVAKTGDPVFQWSLIRNLLREKLLAVVTDFYESTLTVELPPCPNVDPFNYDRMKTSLLERFDAFTGAPFTIQRICELLINPRKEYNRADKYMRAIEKNILVVSTREPGTGKRPLECDQSDSILNGMPDVKLNESDGSLLHVPTDLPYFGAPPASNDVTIETTEPNSNVGRVGSGINGDVNDERDKVCSIQESQKSLVDQDTLQASSRVDLQNEDVPLDIDVKNVEENDCDSNNRLSDIAETINPSIDTEHDNNAKEIVSETSRAALPDSIDSANSPQQECSNSSDALTNDTANAEIEGLSDENEVSSSPANLPDDITVSHVITNETTDSEAEAIDSCLVQDSETEVNSSPDSHDSISEKVSLEHETQISITEVTATRSDEIDLECNEISGTVDSPLSPENAFTEQCDEDVELKNNIECDEESETNAHPDSSNDLGCQNKLQSNESQTCDKDVGSEADAHSEENLDHSVTLSHVALKVVPDQTEDNIAQEISNESLPKDEATAKTTESSSSPALIEDTAVSEGPSSLHANEDNICETSKVAQPDVESTSDVIVEMYDNERRDESVIHSIPHIAQDEIAIEEICVDPSCEADEEAMDVDDGSNQMMVSEGENEAEPMDEGDQLQS